MGRRESTGEGGGMESMGSEGPTNIVWFVSGEDSDIIGSAGEGGGKDNI